MTKRTCQFPKHTCLREINFLKIAGISLLLFCTTSQIAVADSYEKNAVTATQQSKTEKITGKIVDESGEAIIGMLGKSTRKHYRYHHQYGRRVYDTECPQQGRTRNQLASDTSP